MKVMMMTTVYPTCPQALVLLQEYTQNEFLRKHALAVEAVLRHFAGLFGEDIEKWGIIGLVHDLDYETH
jgi:predicted hydrolase (HD superfamily)